MGTKIRNVAKRIDKKLEKAAAQESALEFFRELGEIPPCRFCGRLMLAGACCQAALDHGALIMEDEDAMKLWELEKALWKAVPHTDPRYQSRYWYKETRKITDEELKLVKKLAPKYIVEPTNACMGFNFGINIYAPAMSEEEETFAAGHGIPLKGKVIPLLSLTGHHLDTRFEETWKALSPLSHNKANERKLMRYGFEPLQDEGHYDY